MEYESSEAIIYNLVDYSNTSKIISFLSSSRGKISCIAKGIKRKNNPWRFYSDRLNLVEIQFTWRSSREIQTLTEMNLINNYPEIKKDIQRQTLASLILECAYNLSPKDEKIDTAFSIVKNAFESINNSKINISQLHNTIPTFLWQILKIYGIEPQLTHCSNCGSPLNTLLKLSFYGGAVCDKCPYHITLTKEESSVLYQISQSANCPSINPPIIPNQILIKLVLILCDFITFNSDQNIKSINVYKELFAN